MAALRSGRSATRARIGSGAEDGLEESSLSILSPGWSLPSWKGIPGLSGEGSRPMRRCGVLRTERQWGSRRAVGLLLCGAVLVVPLLLSQDGADASASVAEVRAAPAPVATDRVVTKRTAVRTSPTTTVPAGAPVVIAATPVRQVVPTTTTVPPTTTTVPPTTTTTRPAPMAASSVHSRGDVTYYDHPAGRCASPWLPFGTVVSITNPANGASVTCVVDDREADTARSIDLATASFAEIAPLSQGVVYAILHW